MFFFFPIKTELYRLMYRLKYVNKYRLDFQEMLYRCDGVWLCFSVT